MSHYGRALYHHQQWGEPNSLGPVLGLREWCILPGVKTTTFYGCVAVAALVLGLVNPWVGAALFFGVVALHVLWWAIIGVIALFYWAFGWTESEVVNRAYRQLHRRGRL